LPAADQGEARQAADLGRLQHARFHCRAAHQGHDDAQDQGPGQGQRAGEGGQAGARQRRQAADFQRAA
jgi:hypothetical protein